MSDLTALPDALAAAPLPPMPVEVAERLDRAIATESQARASGWSGAAAQVKPLRPKRRWLAPAVAAAAVIGAVAVALPVLDDQSGSDDSSAGQASDEQFSESGGGAPDGGVPPEVAAPNTGRDGPTALTSDSFGRDVIDAFYNDSGALKASRRLALLESQDPRQEYYTDTLEAVPNPCAARSGPGVRIDDISYDGESAQLLRRDAGRSVDVVAFTCADGEPTILDAVTLSSRS